MRMEELSDSRYIKQTDTVEKYLLNLVQQYFKNSSLASSTSREYIIKRAVDRMKEEMDFDQLGVLSITLPDGIKRTGAVTITLNDLQGEPAITPKKSAFNVSFGTEQNTACEGNDPRLSDKREPLNHKHEIGDVIGLEGILSTLTGQVQRIDSFLHEHKNKSILDMLTYSGTKTTIDLADTENLEAKIMEIIDGITNDMSTYRTEVTNKVAEVNASFQDAHNEVTSIKQYILDTNKQYYDQSKTYTDTKISEADAKIDQKLSSYVKTADLSTLCNIASMSPTLFGSMSIRLSDIMIFDDTTNQFIVDTPISSDILNALGNKSKSLSDAKIELLFNYNSGGQDIVSTLPHIVLDDNTNIVSGHLKAGIAYDNNNIHVILNCDDTIPDYVKNGTIIVNVYCTQTISI